MPASTRMSPGLHSGRLRRLATLIALLGPLAGPGAVRADDSVSCLVRSAVPAVEWTLVTAAVVDTTAPHEPAAMMLLAYAGGTSEAEMLVTPALGTPGPLAAPGPNIFIRAWLPITIGELSLLTVTAMLPKDWTGWSADFVSDGAGNFAEAWTRPPIMDTDHWFHNYVGHPYGGSFYYNSVRCRGATPLQSMAFAAVLSAQWEYVFEAVAERPSIQDLVITPIAGAALGELTHRMSRQMRKGRVTLPEKVVMTILNPANVLAHGYQSSE
jgi:hypothetical protein